MKTGALRLLLLDADDCLFPSEGPAFAASTEVTNELLASLGAERRYDPEELRAVAAGRNFRANATELARAEGLELADDVLEPWVAEERRRVSAHLGAVLQPDPEVRAALEALALRYALAVVSSSALARLDVCFRATGLDDLLPPEARFSAEDSLPVPTSKPDPAVYAFAGEQLGVAGPEALAVEDSVSGTRSAVAAGFPVAGNLVFVPEGERGARTTALREAGATTVVRTWAELTERLTAP